MVRLTTALLSATFFLSAFSLNIGKRTVAQVEADITAIQTDTTKLDNDVNAFPTTPGQGSLLAALTIHSDATTLNTAVQKGTNDTLATPPVSEADGQTILGQVQTLAPTIIDALKAIVARKAAFQALPVGGVVTLVQQDLAALNASTVAFENALVAKAPADLIPNATTIINEINSAFATAIAAYAS